MVVFCASMSPHRPTPEVWHERVQVSKRLHFQTSNGILLCARGRQRSRLCPARKIRTEWRFGSHDTLHANDFILSEPICSTIKENTSTMYFSWSAGWFCAPLHVQLCVNVLVPSGFSYWWNEAGDKMQEGIVFLPSHNFPSQWDPILKDNAGQRLRRLLQKRDMDKNVSGGIYRILVGHRFPVMPLTVPVGSALESFGGSAHLFWLVCVLF